MSSVLLCTVSHALDIVTVRQNIFEEAYWHLLDGLIGAKQK